MTKEKQKKKRENREIPWLFVFIPPQRLPKSELFALQFRRRFGCKPLQNPAVFLSLLPIAAAQRDSPPQSRASRSAAERRQTTGPRPPPEAPPAGLTLTICTSKVGGQGGIGSSRRTSPAARPCHQPAKRSRCPYPGRCISPPSGSPPKTSTAVLHQSSAAQRAVSQEGEALGCLTPGPTHPMALGLSHSSSSATHKPVPAPAHST